MKKIVVLMLLVLAVASGCATHSVVWNHGGSPDGRTFWMSVQNSGGNSSNVEKSIWFCSSDNKAAPVCVQAQLIPCIPGKADCAITANHLLFGEMPSAKP